MKNLKKFILCITMLLLLSFYIPVKTRILNTNNNITFPIKEIIIASNVIWILIICIIYYKKNKYYKENKKGE